MSSKWKYGILSIKGGRNENQDSVWAGQSKFGFVAIVCDGMGGGKGGKLASKTAIDILVTDLKNSNSEDPVNAIYNAIQKANFEVFRTGHNDEDLEGMGTTVALLLLSDNKAFVAHVGDSRIYQIRNQKIIHRSYDHSVVFRMLKDGILTSEEQARNHPQSNQITRALGLVPVVDIELNELEYSKGDYFFLCSDGVNGEISDAEILKIHSKNSPPSNIVDGSIELANKRGISKGGGHDNASALSVLCSTGPQAGSVHSAVNKNNNLKSKPGFLIPAFLLFSLLISIFSIFRLNRRVEKGEVLVKAYEKKIRDHEKTIDSLSQLSNDNSVINDDENFSAEGVYQSSNTEDSSVVEIPDSSVQRSDTLDIE